MAVGDQDRSTQGARVSAGLPLPEGRAVLAGHLAAAALPRRQDSVHRRGGPGRMVMLSTPIHEEELDELEARAARNGTSVSHEVVRALALKAFMDQVRASGGHVYVVDATGNATKLIPPAR